MPMTDQKINFNVLALENILVALTREIGDGPCFLYYIEFSCIGVDSHPSAQNGHLFGIYFLKKLSSHLHCPCPQLLPLEEKRALICARLHPAQSTL